ncbi:MAG: GNAT family N-acetyltransferase [Candidatus Odinarchaeota archaeon]
MTDLNKLFHLTEDHVKKASEVLSRAFYDNPGFIFTIPDDSERKEKLKYIFEYIIRYDVLYGEVYSPSADLEGIAGWIPFEYIYKTYEAKVKSGGKKVVEELGIEFYKRTKKIEEYTDLIHKRNAPFKHWYLAPLGVEPELQGKGYAGILLKAMFARVEKENLPIYLETNTDKNISIYENHGFEILEDTIILDTDVRLCAMLRKTPT